MIPSPNFLYKEGDCRIKKNSISCFQEKSEENNEILTYIP